MTEAFAQFLRKINHTFFFLSAIAGVIEGVDLPSLYLRTKKRTPAAAVAAEAPMKSHLSRSKSGKFPEAVRGASGLAAGAEPPVTVTTMRDNLNQQIIFSRHYHTCICSSSNT